MYFGNSEPDSLSKIFLDIDDVFYNLELGHFREVIYSRTYKYEYLVDDLGSQIITYQFFQYITDNYMCNI